MLTYFKQIINLSLNIFYKHHKSIKLKLITIEVLLIILEQKQIINHFRKILLNILK